MSKTRLASKPEMTHWLAAHVAWSFADNTISRTVECASFSAAIGLVQAVAMKAETADHHPDIDIRWRTVTFRLSTHSEGGLTAKDFEMAQQIDELISASVR
jgi:4a-hydroxytetrahydrobiopterin dehydratase